ncbi:MAG TPA: hypothetical protein VN733_01315 [Solirubrobacterales bacterium]|nr:hypothetical protein [Solirubrobacterales bacterium]
MKHLKMLGLVVMAAAAFVAFFAPGSASATVLCKEYKTPCPVASLYPAGLTVSAGLEAGASSTLKTTGGEAITACKASTVSLKTKNAGKKEELVEGEGSVLTLNECSVTTTVVNAGQFSIQYVPSQPTETRANLWISSLETSVKLFGSVTCTYGGPNTYLGTLTSGAPAGLDVKTVLTRTAGGFLCPTTVVWEGNYIISAPEDLNFKEETK